jgi:hypothetical protein
MISVHNKKCFACDKVEENKIDEITAHRHRHCGVHTRVCCKNNETHRPDCGL